MESRSGAAPSSRAAGLLCRCEKGSRSHEGHICASEHSQLRARTRGRQGDEQEVHRHSGDPARGCCASREKMKFHRKEAADVRWTGVLDERAGRLGVPGG
jgi:hypothetical protein